MNKQREVFYGLRREILKNEDHKEMLMEMAEELVDIVLDEYGTTGSHIAVVRNEEDTTIAVYFEAIIGSIQYMPGEDAEFPRW
jgi:preprotein translocase subunit SecA